MTSAMGIVMPMVNVAHADSARMLTTAKPMAAMAMMTVKRMAMAAMMPAIGPISSRAISASDLPSRRTLEARMTKSCTAPPSGDADEDPQEAGQKAELRRQHRADERPGAGDGGEVVAEEHPAVGGDEVLAVGEAVRRRRRARRRATSTLAAMNAE